MSAQCSAGVKCMKQDLNDQPISIVCRLPSFVTTLQVMGDRIFVGDLQVRIRLVE